MSVIFSERRDRPRLFSDPSRTLLLLVAGVCVGLFAVGCKSPPVGAEGSLAWIEVTGHSAREIEQTTKVVMAREGYRFAKADTELLVFEKPGNAWDEAAYGNWGEGMTVRVKIFVMPQTLESFLVECRAYIVRHAGDRVFEDTHEVTRLRRKPFQKILDEIKAALK